VGEVPAGGAVGLGAGHADGGVQPEAVPQPCPSASFDFRGELPTLPHLRPPSVGRQSFGDTAPNSTAFDVLSTVQ
jgi:hypothetical protein